jgi:hypothetical protein
VRDCVEDWEPVQSRLLRLYEESRKSECKAKTRLLSANINCLRVFTIALFFTNKAA